MQSSQPAPKDIDDYIATQPPAVKTILETIRSSIRKAAPQAQESISYGMPAFTQNGILVYFAAFRSTSASTRQSRAIQAS